MSGGNFSGGSFSSAVGGFSVDVVAVQPAGGTSKKRKKTRLPRHWSEYQEPQPIPAVAMPMVPIEPGILNAIEQIEDEDEVILLAIKRILH